MSPRRSVWLLALLLVGCDETGYSLILHADRIIPDQLDAYCVQLAAGDQVDFAHRYPLTAGDAGTARTLSVLPGPDHFDTFDVLLRGERRGWQVSYERRRLSFVQHQVPAADFYVPSCKGKLGSGQFLDKGRLTDLPPAVAAMPVGFAPGQILTVANTTCGDNTCQPSETQVSCLADCDPKNPPAGSPKKLRQRFAWLRDNNEYRVMRKDDGLPEGPDEAAARILTADIDHDCDLDAIVLYPSGPRVWRQDNGQLSELQGAIKVSDSFSSGAVADLDGDGDGSVDLVLVGKDKVQVLLNDGKGFFADASSMLPSSLTGGADGVAVGFITGDMLPDIVLARGAQTQKVNALLVAQAAPGEAFKVRYELQELTGLGDRSGAVAVAELNGDKWHDIVFGNVGVESVVYLNDPLSPGTLGKPENTKPLLGTNGDNVVDMLAVDLTGECHADLVLLRDKSSPRLMFNDGRGTFKEQDQLDATKVATQVAVVDLDGDGLLDLVFGGNPVGAFWMQQRP